MNLRRELFTGKLDRQARIVPPINSLLFGVYLSVVVLAYIRPTRILNEIIILISIILALDGIYFFMIAPYIEVTLVPKVMVEVGQEFKQHIKVRNRAYLPSPYIYLMPGQGQRISIENQKCIGLLLGAREDVEQEIFYRAKYCGIEQMTLDWVVTRSFFCFFRKEIKLQETTTVQIMPEVKPLNYLNPFNSFITQMLIREERALGHENGENGRDIDDEIGYELRPYREGDSERLIHWKLAVFKEEYLVREREKIKEQRRELFFILNPFMGKEVRDEEENSNEILEHNKTVTSFISLVAYYLIKGQKVRIAYYKEKEWQHMKLKGIGELRYLQECLSHYRSIYIGDTMNQEDAIHHREMIHSLFSMIHKRVGIKIMISGYWKQEVEAYAMPIIWTGSYLNEDLVKESRFPLWHMTDEYSLVLAENTNLGGNHEQT